MATLLLADLHPTGGSEIRSGNRIATSISSLIPIQLDEDGCPLQTQAFPASTLFLKKINPTMGPWHPRLDQILGRAPSGRPFFLDDIGLQWANPSMGFPLPKNLNHALKYLRTLLSSKSPEDWHLIKTKISGPRTTNLSIAPRLRDIFTPAWDNLPNGPSTLSVSKASRQPTIMEAMGNVPTCTSKPTNMAGTRIVLHLKRKRKKGPKRNPASKQKPTPTIEPLRGSDAPGGNASILRVLSHTEPRRVKHNRRYTCVEEFLVQ